MMEKRILGLCLRVWTNTREDVAVIYAEPDLADLKSLVSDSNVINLLSELLWPTEPSFGTTTNGIPESPEKLNARKTNIQDDFDSCDKQKVDYNENQSEEDKDAAYFDHPDEDDVSMTEDDDMSTADEEEENLDELDELLDATVKMEQDFDGQEEFEKMEDGHYRCKRCKETFPTLRNIRSHLRLDKSCSLTCDACNKAFKRKAQLKLHMDRCSATHASISCAHCPQTFTSKVKLRTHMKSEHPAQGYGCRFCDYTAPTEEYRTTHERKVHLNLKCKVCRRICDSEQDLEEHTCVKPDRFQCDRCEKSYLMKAELKKHISAAHDGQRFACTVCADVLSSSQALKRHVRNVHELKVKNFKCQFCGKSFKDKQTLHKHEKIHDDATKSDPCPECGKVLSSNDVLKIHIKRVHERNFKHTCEDCGKSYPYLHALQIHAEMAHMKGAAFVCTECGKEFIGKHRLRNHMVQKHPKGQEFTDCEHCGKEVPVTQLRSHVVEAHKMQGYKFQCTFCPKRFDTKAHIREHIRKHTGARPYLCRGCGKYFFCRETAKKHVRLFHGEDISLVYYDISKDGGNPYVS